MELNNVTFEQLCYISYKYTCILNIYTFSDFINTKYKIIFLTTVRILSQVSVSNQIVANSEEKLAKYRNSATRVLLRERRERCKSRIETTWSTCIATISTLFRVSLARLSRHRDFSPFSARAARFITVELNFDLDLRKPWTCDRDSLPPRHSI